MAYAADLCGSKLKAKLASTLNESSAAPISSNSCAARQMAKMGWKEGTGLGKKRNGITSHIKVKKREENSGLGIEKERTRKLGVEGMWWSSNVSDTLMRLQQKKNGDKKSKKSKKEKKDKKSKKKNKEKSPKVYTDEELFHATGGARFGMRAQRRAEGKWQRTEHSQSLKEWEEAVKSKIEWNGLGKAQVLLKGESASSDSVDEPCKKKRKRRDVDDSAEEKKCENEIYMENSLSLTGQSNEGNSDSSGSRMKKKRKSERKSKKSKKTKKSS